MMPAKEKQQVSSKVSQEFCFYKYVGAGNDFIIFYDTSLPALSPDRIKDLCHRQFGVGADGLIVLQKISDPKADFEMLYFNADGYQAEMCGNGLRCCIDLIHRYIQKQTLYRLVSAGQYFQGSWREGSISILWPEPEVFEWELELEDLAVKGSYLDTGVPHFVCRVDKLEDFPVEKLGQELRYHPFFSPRGVNVNFVEFLSSTDLLIRTYERGVEAETLACGTGCVAAALTYMRESNELKVGLRCASGEWLHVEKKPEGVYLSGPAVCTFTGRVQL